MNRFSLVYEVSLFARWSLSLLSKIFKVAPYHAAIVMLLSMASQVLLLLAFFIPLKVVILIGSDGIPRYFPESLVSYGKEGLIITLAALSVVLYIIYIIADRLVYLLADAGARALLDRSNKLVMYANQEEIARQLFQRFLVMISSLFFSFFALAGIWFINPNLAYMVLGLIVVIIVAMMIMCNQSGRARGYIYELRSVFLNSSAGLLFLGAFGFIVFSFIYTKTSGVYVSIVSLLLVRQMSQRLSQGILDGITLSSQRMQISSLFFHSQPLVGASLQEDRNKIWEVVGTARRHDLAEAVLKQIMQRVYKADNFCWVETGIFGTVAYEVDVVSSKESFRCFIKVFDKGRGSTSQHESKLLSTFRRSEIPAFEFLGAANYSGYCVHVFKSFPTSSVELVEQNVCGCEVISGLWALDVPSSLVDVFSRSKPSLLDRIKKEDIKHLSLAAVSDAEYESVAQVVEFFDSIREVIRSLPLCVYNPELNMSTMRKCEGRIVVLHWGAWCLEPVGAGWFFRDNEHKLIESYLAKARVGRIALSHVETVDVKLASLVFALEFYCRRQSFRAAIDLLQPIIDSFGATQLSLKNKSNN